VQHTEHNKRPSTRTHRCTSYVATVQLAVQVNVGFDIIGVKVCPLNDSHVAVWGVMRCAVVVFSNPSAGEIHDIIHMLKSDMHSSSV
jgi:hypothetical protein